MWPRSDLFLWHTKSFFRKNCSLNCYWWCVWHMTRFMHSNQHLLTSECWQKFQSLIQRKIELISKKVWREKKGKMFRLRSWFCSMWINKNRFWRTFVLHSAGRWCGDEAATYVAPYWLSINKQTNLNKTMSKRKSFKKQFHQKYLSLITLPLTEMKEIKCSFLKGKKTR